MSAYDSISIGLNQALAYAQGKTAGARLHKIEIPEVDVALIRQKTGLSQSDFAKASGLPRAPC